MLSVPKRLRYFLEREPGAVTAVLHSFLRVVEAHLRRSSPGVLFLTLIRVSPPAIGNILPPVEGERG